MSGRHGCGFFGVTERMSLVLFCLERMECFFEEETLTLTSGLCYQWLHVVLPAFRSVKQTHQLTKIDPI